MSNLGDDDYLEEFEEIGPTVYTVSEEVSNWQTFSQTTWEDTDMDDEFCKRLKAELDAFRAKNPYGGGNAEKRS